MGRTAKNMKFSFGRTPMFNGKEPLKVFSWLRKFVKACDDNDVSERMGLYLFPNFVAGDAESRFTRNLPGSDIAGGRGSLGSFPAAVNWLSSTYAEPHALGLAQDKFSRVALVDNEGVDAFAARLRSLAGRRTTRRRTTQSRCCRRVPRGSARPKERPTLCERPRRVPRCATCVKHADTESLIARF